MNKRDIVNGFVIVHVPHASLYIPEFYRNTILLDDKRLKQEMHRMTDAFCDELYFSPDFKNRITAPVSRLVCDVERFRDDEHEAFAKRGQGLMYTKCSDGRRLRRNDEALRSLILAEFYDPHHKKFTRMVDEILERYGKCLIIDGHSFPAKTSTASKINKKLRYPDFDIGTDDFHTPNGLRDALYDKVKKLGYSAKINKPYAGAITPMKFYRKDKNVFSVMIETNRNLYLNRKFEKSRAACRALMVCAAEYVM